jgi:hypothetical protein
MWRVVVFDQETPGKQTINNLATAWQLKGI